MSDDNSNSELDYLTVKIPRGAYSMLSEIKYLRSQRTGEPTYNTVLLPELIERELDSERKRAGQTKQ